MNSNILYMLILKGVVAQYIKSIIFIYSTMYYTGMCVCNMHTSTVIYTLSVKFLFLNFFSAPNDLPNLGPRLFLFTIYLLFGNIFCWNKPLAITHILIS